MQVQIRNEVSTLNILQKINKQINNNNRYVADNFLFQLIFVFPLLKILFISTHYHAQKQWKNNSYLKQNINYNSYTKIKDMT